MNMPGLDRMIDSVFGSTDEDVVLRKLNHLIDQDIDPRTAIYEMFLSWEGAGILRKILGRYPRVFRLIAMHPEWVAKYLPETLNYIATTAEQAAYYQHRRSAEAEAAQAAQAATKAQRRQHA